VAMMVLLLDGTNAEFCVRQELASGLARLGVASLTLVRDEHTVGVVLEGWLFDPVRSVAAAAEALGAASGARTLHQLMHLARPPASARTAASSPPTEHPRPAICSKGNRGCDTREGSPSADTVRSPCRRWRRDDRRLQDRQRSAPRHRRVGATAHAARVSLERLTATQARVAAPFADRLATTVARRPRNHLRPRGAASAPRPGCASSSSCAKGASFRLASWSSGSSCGSQRSSRSTLIRLRV
jgi:hypothetical protein